MPESNRPLLIIDLGAIGANFALLGKHLGAIACAAAIKADCYGMGMARVAPVLAASGCRDFFVATLEEGIAARQSLPGAAIHVLFGPTKEDRGAFFKHGLVPVLNTLPQIEEWLARGEAELARPVALHLDTGMARLGLTRGEALALIENGRQLPRMNVALVMSHLACAEEPDHEMNRRQLAEFGDLSRQLLAALANRPLLSLVNSSGIFLGPDYHFDLARPGAALYGLNPVPGQPNPMRPVVTLMAPILQARAIDAGKCVGYGATHRFSRPTRLATIGLGYADGLMRALGDTGAFHVGDFRASIVGRVSMDLVTIDVGHVPEHLTRPGAMVEILGPRQDADALGHAAGTNGYELLTALGRRIGRHYLAAE